MDLAKWRQTVKEMADKQQQIREPINVRLGKALDKARRDSGISKAQVTCALNMDIKTLNFYLSGERDASVPWIERYAEMVGTTIGAIFDAAEIIDSGNVEALIDNDGELSSESKDLLKVLIRSAREASARKKK